MTWIKKNWQTNLPFFNSGIIAILHFVGFFGLRSEMQETFAMLTPLNLLISFLLILPCKEGTWKQLIQFFSIAFIIGMIIEIIGVQTGFPFGVYHYTELLSISILGVPLLIGVNWFLLSYGIISLLNWQRQDFSYVVKSIIGALLMTGMDVLIEPFAIKHKLWVWESSEVPLENYISWFLISLVIFSVGFRIYPKNFNKVAALTLLIFFVFFGLNFLLV